MNAIITGGGGDIGSACARLLACSGGNVLVVDAVLEAAERVVREINERAEGKAIATAADVSIAADVQRYVAQAATWGPVDVIVHAAGIAGPAAPLQGWPLPVAIDALQKVCHDALCVACGGAPRYFPRDRVASGASLAALLRWSRELGRVATEAEHPWSVDLAVESLVGQGREALKTSRSTEGEGGGLSIHSRR